MKQTNLLALKSCTPSREGTLPLSLASQRSLLSKLDPEWRVISGTRLRREFFFPEFRRALRSVQLMGEIAEREGHHPIILLEYGRLVVDIYTHKVGGLTENDFILAAKYDAISL